MAKRPNSTHTIPDDDGWTLPGFIRGVQGLFIDDLKFTYRPYQSQERSAILEAIDGKASTDADAILFRALNVKFRPFGPVTVRACLCDATGGNSQIVQRQGPWECEAELTGLVGNGARYPISSNLGAYYYRWSTAIPWATLLDGIYVLSTAPLSYNIVDNYCFWSGSGQVNYTASDDYIRSLEGKSIYSPWSQSRRITYGLGLDLFLSEPGATWWWRLRLSWQDDLVGADYDGRSTSYAVDGYWGPNWRSASLSWSDPRTLASLALAPDMSYVNYLTSPEDATITASP